MFASSQKQSESTEPLPQGSAKSSRLKPERSCCCGSGRPGQLVSVPLVQASYPSDNFDPAKIT